ncbi:MAG: hypothetical protein DRP45_09815 [Candidatus Zixiibacteriota bacterium]|nr:MAG: hypothetical protein DRP45_09815 [candidate division Zixibacteria bacterium]
MKFVVEMMRMNRFLRFWIVLLVLTMVISILVGCRDDIVVPPPASLIGLYEGTYTYREICGIDTNWDTTQLVTMRFTNTSYSMMMDAIVPDTERVFCDVMGDYELVGGCKLEQTDSNLTNMVCTPRQNPKGSFGINFADSVGDIMRLFHDSTDASGCKIQKLIIAVKTL